MPDFDTNADGIPGTLLSAAIDRVRFRRPVLVAILCAQLGASGAVIVPWSASGAVAGAGASSGSTLTLMVLRDVSGADTSDPPEELPAIQSVFHGTHATVLSCDNQGTTTGNLSCEHEAVTDHVDVVLEADENEDQSLLNDAGIPVVGVTDNDTDPNSFDTSGQESLFVGMAAVLHKGGCQRVGVVIDEAGEKYAAQVAKALKWQTVTESFIPVTAADLSANVAKLVSGKVQCVAAASIPSQLPQIMIAMKQANLKVPTAVPGVILSSAVMSSLGSLSKGLIEVVGAPDPTAPSAAVAAVSKQIHAVNPRIKISQYSLDGWGNAKIIQAASRNIHLPVTASSVRRALNQLRNVSTDGLFPPLSMMPLPIAGDQRNFDPYVIAYTLEKGKATKSTGYLNVEPELKAAAAGGGGG